MTRNQVDQGAVLDLTFGAVEALALPILILCSSCIPSNLRHLKLIRTLDQLGLPLVSL